MQQCHTKHACCTRLSVTLLSNQLRLRSARLKELAKGFTEMHASALQRTPKMKAILDSEACSCMGVLPLGLCSCSRKAPELLVECISALERPQQGLNDGAHLAAAIFTAALSAQWRRAFSVASGVLH